MDWILKNSDTLLPLITLIVYLILWKKIARADLILFFYLLVNILVFAASNMLADRHINNLFLYHFYSLFELLLITYYLTTVLLKKIKLFFFIALVYTSFWLLNLFVWESLNGFNSNAASLANIIMLILSMYYLLQLSKSDDILNFQRLPAFWFASAFLISSAISILSLVAYKYFVQNNLPVEGFKVWILTSIGNDIKFILLIVGLLCYNSKRRSMSSILLL